MLACFHFNFYKMVGNQQKRHKPFEGHLLFIPTRQVVTSPSGNGECRERTAWQEDTYVEPVPEELFATLQQTKRGIQ